MRPEIVQQIGAEHKVALKFPLQTEIRLLNRRILQIVVNNVDAGCACARQNKTNKRICESRCKRQKSAVLVKKDRHAVLVGQSISGANRNR